MNLVVFSSECQSWATPPRFFAAVDAEFGFTLDACAVPENATCARYFTPHDDGLSQPWEGVVWCNPPYGSRIGAWVAKAWRESVRGSTVVMLIPAKTETRWWHDFVMRADEIRLIRGRMRFSGSAVNAPFPSCLVVFRPSPGASPQFTTMDRLLELEVAS